MTRKIQNVKFPLSKASIVKVKKYYKLQNGLKINSTNRILFSKMLENSLIFGNDENDDVDTEEAYQILADIYNENNDIENAKILDAKKEARRRKGKKYIKNENLKQQIQNIEESKSFLESIASFFTETEGERIVKVKNIKPIVHIEKLHDFVNNWKNTNGDSAFNLTIKSTKADVKRQYKFRCFTHFFNWFKMLLTKEIDSAGNEFDSEGLFSDYIVVDDISVIAGGCNKHKEGIKNMKSSFYNYKLFNPCSMNNNCFFHCLQKITNLCINSLNIRKHYKIATNTPISVNDAYQIMRDMNFNDIDIIDYDNNDILDEEKSYILIKDNHYFVVESWEEINRKDKKTKRGLLTFDFETRPTEEYHFIKASSKKSFILKDTICCLHYNNYKSEVLENLCLTTNDEKSSARQFIDWLNSQAKLNKTYNVLAHNGGKFDFYFFIASLTEKELLECDIGMRGTTVISINYRGNLFKDSCCFITDSLSNISKSYNIEEGKITSMILHNETISSTQLCFYKDKLSFDEFMNLQQTDKEFWNLYTIYCRYDCIALYQIWKKFNLCINSMIEAISPSLLLKCPLMSSSTIGSHSKKILVCINQFKGEKNYHKQGLERFMGVSIIDKVAVVDTDKYKFLCKFKRGGISHCQKMGKHTTGVVDVDIASQYPASLIYAYCPTGVSKWVDEYKPEYKGFYHIKDIVFEEGTQLFKPVAKSILGTSLQWGSNDMDELYIDSYMLDYIMKNHGLKSFSVISGLVSEREICMDKLFGSYVNTFYAEKKLQDVYKDDESSLYNPALRAVIKLYLNSLTGKLVEEPSVHFSLKFEEESKLKINGTGVGKEFNTGKFNDWLVAGIMVYSYSKRLLFEYIKCLPNKSDDVIHVETDGIFFPLNCLEEFKQNIENYEGSYPCKLGDELGNLKIDKQTEKGDTDHFLGKKFYQFGKTYRIKGIPQATIDDAGNKIQLVNNQLYEKVYNGEKVAKSFKTLRKSFFSQNTQISTHTLTREIKPNGIYQEYN